MAPSISVIIPVFNRKDIVVRALKSVLGQTLPPDEVIVVDDGSRDGTGPFIQHHFPQIRYFYQENRGPAAARNHGIQKAQGEWIAFLDSDDEWLPGKLKAQAAFTAAHPEYRVSQAEEIWIRRGVRVNPMKKHKKTGGYIFEKCLPLCLISPSSVLIHRGVFKECGMFDESFPACEDYELWLRITSRYEVGFIEKPYVVKYGGHEDQLSRRFPAMDRFRIHALAKLLQSGILTPEQERQAAAMLEVKTQIYIKGALKRGKITQPEAREITRHSPNLDRFRSLTGL